MSSRQLRRLKNLVRTTTGADNDNDDEDKCFSTIKMSRGGRKTRMLPNEKEVQKIWNGHCDDDNDNKERQYKRTPATSLSERELFVKTDKMETKGAQLKAGESNAIEKLETENSERRSKEDDICSERLRQGEANDERERKKQQKKNYRAKRREAEREEELLLEALLKRREEEDFGTGGNACGGAEFFIGNTDLLSILSICNHKMLDPRRERIRRFGVKVVEDVGDGRGQRRRAENRAMPLLFLEHVNFTPRFFRSFLATPNRYCWPQYDSLGVSLSVKSESEDNKEGPSGSLVYYFDNVTNEARRADVALALCNSFHQGVEGIMTCLRNTPYHIPTLIHASTMFEIMGDIPRAQESINIALYHVGVLLSRFPVRQTVRRRRLPFSISSNKEIFQIVRCGVHQALKKAATRTALEIAKLLYSFDEKDPFGMLLLLDYLALRSRQWAWLVHVYFILMKEEQNYMADAGDSVSDELSNRTLALALSTLPGYFFSAALAKYFLEREEATMYEMNGNAHRTGKAKKGSSRIFCDMTSDQLHAFRNTPPAAELLASAIARFPSAAVLLVEKAGITAAVSSLNLEPWNEVVKQHNAADPDTDNMHVINLWVARNAEIWNAMEQKMFLQAVISQDEGHLLQSCVILNTTFISHCPNPLQYASLSEKDLMGQTLTVIPEHLLNATEDTEEDMRNETRRAMLRELQPLEHITLLRFQALYGNSLPATLSPAEQLTQYVRMFEEEGRIRNIGREQNIFSLFFRTLAPWNSTIDMALRAALEEANIPDPAIEHSNMLRAEEEEFWRSAEEAANDDEEGGWETEESWYSSEYLVGDSEDNETQGDGD